MQANTTRAETHSQIHSMTGFGTSELEVNGARLRMEIRALNHRFLDIKIKLPREYASAELPLRAAIQARFSRGSIEAKLERLTDTTSLPAPVQVNLSLAAHYFESMISIQKTLGLSDPIRTTDILSFPDVIMRAGSEGPLPAEEAWTRIESLATGAMDRMMEMRKHEGASLKTTLLAAMHELEQTAQRLRERRQECEALYRKRFQEKIKAVFDLYPVPSGDAQLVLESRIAQELAILLDRTDIEEELTRFKGHLDHAKKALNQGGQVGRKCDFIFQELGREINTLGNKAQDLQIGEEVVQVKVRLEQLREQIMNIE